MRNNKELKFTLYDLKSGTNADKYKIISLEKIYNLVTDPKYLKAQTDDYREVLDLFGKDDEKTKARKKALPMIKWSGEFTGWDQKSFVEGTYNGTCGFDIDPKDNLGANWEDLFVKIAGDPHVVFVMVSPSKGIKGLIALDYAFTKHDRYTKDVKDKVFPHFAKKWGCKFDNGQASFSLGMFMCHDALADFKSQSQPFEVDAQTNLDFITEGISNIAQIETIDSFLKVLSDLHPGQVFEKSKGIATLVAKKIKGGSLNIEPNAALTLMHNAIVKAPGVTNTKKAKSDITGAFNWAMKSEDVVGITKEDIASETFWKKIAWSLRQNIWDDRVEYVMVGNNYYSSRDETNLRLRSKEAIQKRFPGNKEIFLRIPEYEDFTLKHDFKAFERIIDGQFWNLASPLSFTPQEGQWPTIGKLMQHLFGESHLENDQRDLIYDWMKELLENPSQKLIIPCLVSRAQGSGKSTFLNLLSEIFGGNSITLKSTEMKREFNSAYADKLLVCLDEIPKSNSDLFIEDVKQISTQTSIHVNPKGASEYDLPCNIHFVMASNKVEEFIKVEDEDRRLWIREIPAFDQEKADLNFVSKMLAEVPAFVHFLFTRAEVYPRDPGLRFQRRDYETNAKKKAITANKSEVYHKLCKEIANLFEAKYVNCSKLILNMNELYDLTSDMIRRPEFGEFKQKFTEAFPNKEYKNNRLINEQHVLDKAKSAQKKGYTFHREEVGVDSLEGISNEPIFKTASVFG